MVLVVLMVLTGCDADKAIRLQPDHARNGGGAGDSTVDSASDTAPDPVDDSGEPAFLPSSCAAIAAARPDATDGAYTLYVGGDSAQPWTAWCQDMATTPVEYLTLDTRDGAANFAAYAADSSSNAGVRTVYARVRIDPVTLLVDVSDQRFATSSGRLESSGTQVTSMPYGVAMSCTYGVSGLGSVDLSGTAFRVAADAFVVGGYNATGQASYSADARAVELQGGGYCGWIAPAPGIYNPVNDAGDFLLPLAWAG